jgi:hypothetical protein
VTLALSLNLFSTLINIVKKYIDALLRKEIFRKERIVMASLCAFAGFFPPHSLQIKVIENVVLVEVMWVLIYAQLGIVRVATRLLLLLVVHVRMVVLQLLWKVEIFLVLVVVVVDDDLRECQLQIVYSLREREELLAKLILDRSRSLPLNSVAR